MAARAQVAVFSVFSSDTYSTPHTITPERIMIKTILSTSILQFILMLALIMVPSMGLAEEVVQGRCFADLLTPSAAIQRIEWARRCALTTNTGGPDSWFLSARAFDMLFEPAKDYREIDPDHAYSGNSNDYNVNY